MTTPKSVRGQVLAFDIYGTILNTNGLNPALQSQLNISEGEAAQLSLSRRKYQLEYTWRLNSMGIYEPFDKVTANALRNALLEHKVTASDEQVTQLMGAYDHLPPFDDALHALHALSRLPHVKILIFSNGTQEMVTTALKSASILSIPDGLFLADTVQIYKPAKEIYHGLVAHVNKKKEGDKESQTYTGDDVWLVSGNPFDVTGARNAGLQAIWVDRANGGWMDQAVSLRPSKTVNSLGGIVGFMGGKE